MEVQARGRQRTEINLFADLETTKAPDVPTKNHKRISREMFETAVRLVTLAQVQDNIPPKLRAEIPRHTFGAAVRLDTVAQVQIDVPTRLNLVCET